MFLLDFFEAFRHYDTEMEGSILVKDVRPALLALGQTPTDKELNNIIDLIDNEGNAICSNVFLLQNKSVASTT